MACIICGAEKHTEDGLCAECAQYLEETEDDREAERRAIDELLEMVERELHDIRP